MSVFVDGLRLFLGKGHLTNTKRLTPTDWELLFSELEVLVPAEESTSWLIISSGASRGQVSHLEKWDWRPFVQPCPESSGEFTLNAMKLCGECFKLNCWELGWAASSCQGWPTGKHSAIFSNPVGEFVWSPVRDLLVYWEESSACSVWETLFYSVGGKQ